MTTSLGVTFVGRDRPGLVNALAVAVAAAGGNWLESRLARLAGEFAGIVLVGVPATQLAALTAALQALEQGGLHVRVEPTVSAEARRNMTIFDINLIGHDRPGIVRDVTTELLKFGVSIEEFSTHTGSAPFAGEIMFHLAARFAMPEESAIEELRDALERLAGEIMVDLAVKEVPEQA
ncbi:MAG: glycine cleavage system protein R [Acetobacteraceae bacterium]